MSDRLTIAHIDLRSYRNNLKYLLEKVDSGVTLLAVVKANAYGHGIEQIAATAIEAGANYLGVVSVGELKRVRNAGVAAPVLILNYCDDESMNEVVQLGGSITVMNEESIIAVQTAAQAQSSSTNVHIKIDTGMHRAGCTPSDLLELAKKVQAAPNLNLEGIFTHFAESEDSDDAFTRQQLEVFRSCISELKAHGIEPTLIHAANSAAIFTLPEAHFTMVRPGLITYGLNPFPKTHALYQKVEDNFTPILSLRTQVIFLRDLQPGESVGYNRRWTAARPSKVALLPVGYGDGWRRSLHNAGRVLVNGRYAPIIGSVAMDQTTIDVTDIPSVKTGDEVILIGEQQESSISALDVAEALNTINYEVVTGLSDRIVRTYIN